MIFCTFDTRNNKTREARLRNSAAHSRLRTLRKKENKGRNKARAEKHRPRKKRRWRRRRRRKSWKRNIRTSGGKEEEEEEEDEPRVGKVRDARLRNACVRSWIRTCVDVWPAYTHASRMRIDSISFSSPWRRSVASERDPSVDLSNRFNSCRDFSFEWARIFYRCMYSTRKQDFLLLKIKRYPDFSKIDIHCILLQITKFII